VVVEGLESKIQAVAEGQAHLTAKVDALESWTGGWMP